MLLPVDFSQQIVPGSFEHALCYLVDQELDLSGLRGRYRNDEQGASAYDPAVLLKIVLLAYSRGLIGSRRIEAACQQKVDGQWKLYCLVHNIEKLAHHGLGR